VEAIGGRVYRMTFRRLAMRYMPRQAVQEPPNLIGKRHMSSGQKPRLLVKPHCHCKDHGFSMARQLGFKIRSGIRPPMPRRLVRISLAIVCRMSLVRFVPN
jgi:hypothetical protein